MFDYILFVFLMIITRKYLNIAKGNINVGLVDDFTVKI